MVPTSVPISTSSVIILSRNIRDLWSAECSLANLPAFTFEPLSCLLYLHPGPLQLPSFSLNCVCAQVWTFVSPHLVFVFVSWGLFAWEENLGTLSNLTNLFFVIFSLTKNIFFVQPDDVRNTIKRSISHVLIIGSLHAPTVSNEHDFQ